MKATIVVLLALCFGGIALGDDADNFRTSGFTNGRAWTGLPEAFKFIYLQGYTEGAMLVPCRVMSLENQKILPLPKGFTLKEIVAGLDLFYSDWANIRFPIPLAIAFVGRRFEGGSAADLERDVAAARKVLSGEETEKRNVKQ